MGGVTRRVRIANNHIQVVGDPDEGFTAGIYIGTDVGTEGYAGTITVKNNTIVMQDGNGAMIFGSETERDWMSVLNGATVRNNQIRGYAQYGMLSINGAQYCNIFGDELDTFTPSVTTLAFSDRERTTTQCTGTLAWLLRLMAPKTIPSQATHRCRPSRDPHEQAVP